jgi:NAD(P)-dependent dehydrogenase (short-subunit alcohol dehydrogenase family)
MGHAVAIVGRSREHLEVAEASLRDEAVELMTCRGDVRDEDAVDEIVSVVERELGPVEVAVHAAGACAALGPTWEVDGAQWRADVETSLVGAYVLIRRVVPGMIDRRRGRLVAVNSYAAVRPAPHQSAYAAGKAALASLVESLDAELVGTGVRAFSVTPGFVWTAMTTAMADTPWFSNLSDRTDALPPQRFAALVARVARGDADPLSGRFLHALDDLDDLLARTEEIAADDLYAPRLRRLETSAGT